MRKAASLGALLGAGLLVSLGLSGCYTTSGGYYPHTGGGFTYISTSSLPVTVAVINVCERDENHPNGTPFFIMEIPPGKQLTFNFEESGGDDQAKRPSRMMYSVWVADTMTGSLENQLSCPPAACRRIDVSYRPAPEAPRPDESYRLQVYDSTQPTATAQPRAPVPARTTADDR
ncbi:MAG: hypothetical protein U0636_08410 [Phycisphaerales bacterium]